MDEEEYYDNPQEFKKASEPEKGAVRAETLPSPPPPPTASLTTAEAGLIKSLQRTYTREELIIKMQARCKGNLARKNLQQAKKDTAASTAKAGLGVVKLAYQATSTVVKAARAKSIGDAFETLSERKDDIADAAKDALSNTSSVIGNAKHTRELKREAAAIQQHAEGRIQELEARKQRAEMALDGVLDSSQSAKLLEKQNQDIEKIQQNIRKVEKSRRQLKRLSREISTLDVTNQQNASAAPNIDPIEQRIAALTIERALLRNQERKRKTKSYLQIAHKSYQAASSAAAVISKGVSTTVDLVSVVATTPTVVVAIIMAGQTALDAGKVVVAAGNTISRGVALASSVRDERRLSRQYSETMLQTTNELHELRRTQTQSRLQTIQLMEE
ncbi:MAG: hypothetical protein ACD_21C00048G0003 [uncultured bacterium]|nr:MAG: hypothetical protein ACD_21C00048G0003 [uncultured bacterium]